MLVWYGFGPRHREELLKRKYKLEYVFHLKFHNIQLIQYILSQITMSNLIDLSKPHRTIRAGVLLVNS
jgi:hypothetical protein